MKPRLLELLVCPGCSRGLKQIVFRADGDATIEGLLTCECGCAFPVVDGIPRFIDDALVVFSDFAKRHATRLADHATTAAVEGAGEMTADLQRTRESFGYQWTRFSEMATDFRSSGPAVRSFWGHFCFMLPPQGSIFGVMWVTFWLPKASRDSILGGWGPCRAGF